MRYMVVAFVWLFAGAMTFLLLDDSHISYWLLWPGAIGFWFTLGIILFAVFEARGMRHGERKDRISLSFFLYTIGSKFPLSILAAGLFTGLFIGGLGVHVLWHYCPPGSLSGG
jgi:hypothetical protein